MFIMVCKYLLIKDCNLLEVVFVFFYVFDLYKKMKFILVLNICSFVFLDMVLDFFIGFRIIKVVFVFLIFYWLILLDLLFLLMLLLRLVKFFILLMFFLFSFSLFVFLVLIFFFVFDLLILRLGFVEIIFFWVSLFGMYVLLIMWE